MLSGLNGVDAALLGALGLSMLLGLMRGLVYEVMSLIGWAVAYVAAYLFSPQVLAWLPSGRLAGAGVAVQAEFMPFVAFALCFAAVLIAWGLVSHLVRLLVRATPLSGLDRVLGGVFGLLRGVLLLLAVSVVVAMTPWSQAAAWRGSATVGWLHAGTRWVEPLLPPGAARWLGR